MERVGARHFPSEPDRNLRHGLQSFGGFSTRPSLLPGIFVPVSCSLRRRYPRRLSCVSTCRGPKSVDRWTGFSSRNASLSLSIGQLRTRVGLAVDVVSRTLRMSRRGIAVCSPAKPPNEGRRCVSMTAVLQQVRAYIYVRRT